MKPINYELKSDLEKKSILDLYYSFLKTANFNFEILIKSFKQNIDENIKFLEKENCFESIDSNKNMILSEYIKYLKKLSFESKSSYKQFFIIINKDINLNDEDIKKEFNKIQEKVNILKKQKQYIDQTLSKAGNYIEIMKGEKLLKVLKDFYR